MTTEKFENGNDLEGGHLNALESVRSAANITMSSELFEKLYLSPPNAVKGNLRQTFGNPTPMSVCLFTYLVTANTYPGDSLDSSLLLCPCHAVSWAGEALAASVQLLCRLISLESSSVF